MEKDKNTNFKVGDVVFVSFNNAFNKNSYAKGTIISDEKNYHGDYLVRFLDNTVGFKMKGLFLDGVPADIVRKYYDDDCSYCWIKNNDKHIKITKEKM